MTRTARTFVAIAAAALAVTACGPARPGAAAVVGSSRITVDDLHALTARALADPAAEQKFPDKAAFQRRELNQLIEHRLLQVAADKLGVHVAPGDVDARLNQYVTQAGGLTQLQKSAAGDGVAPADLRTAVSDLVLGDALADKLTADTKVDPQSLQAAYQANIDQFDRVRSAHILVASETLARSLLAQAKAAPTKFAALASKYSTDPGSKPKGGELGFAGRSQFVKPYADAIFAGKPGDIVLAHSEFGWHVIRIEERQTTTLAEAAPQLRRTILGQARDKALSDYLAETAKRLKVSVSPRYGKWDQKTHSVVAADDGLSTPPGSGATPTPEATPPAGG
ncbi:MAG: peptidyl-prolyl cis-trans isomerase [Frankiales bacterium]|nr:peptidyl-prolyl cis-trans isomerase [Frankiales bacterium]